MTRQLQVVWVSLKSLWLYLHLVLLQPRSLASPSPPSASSEPLAPLLRKRVGCWGKLSPEERRKEVVWRGRYVSLVAEVTWGVAVWQK